MPSSDRPDVLVIGGGVVGLFCAYHLRRTGLAVTVVERGPIGGPQSCSSGNTGFVGTQGSMPLAEPSALAQGMRGLLNPESPLHIRPRWDGELLRWLWHFRRACNEEDAKAGFRILLDLKQRSLEILRELDASTFTQQGIVLAYKTPQAFERACRSVPDGVPLRVLELAELRKLEPDVEYDISGALFNEEGAYLHVPEFLTEFAQTLAGIGVEILAATEVLGFAVKDHKVIQVRTDRGYFRPQQTVIAAGTWSAECARKLDIGLTLQPAKGYAITVPASGKALRHPVILSEGRIAVAPLGDRVRFGGTLELSGMDSTISPRRVDAMLRTVREYLPALDTGEPREVWTGLRPCTPDGLPILGRADPYLNVVVACGHGHIGMGLAPASGRLIAQIVSGERPDMDLTPFRVDRYARHHRSAS